jgi:heme a synthase
MILAADARCRAIQIWLAAVAALVFAIVIVGGATRLTESGLSIVEWRPVTGALPPLSESAWLAEFEKYKAIPQYQHVNRGMSLDAFKTIYWWEWAHRFLGRLIGAAFLLPFVWFLWKGWIERPLRGRLWFIFTLGALQGAVGWWMVASGLSERVTVSPYRLGFHLTLACVIFAALLWTILRLSPRPPSAAPSRIRYAAVALLGLVLAQIFLGALVAGLRAGYLYNTWPLIDGALIPAGDRLLFLSPLWRNFFENELTVQFLHRMTAYALWAAAILHAIDAWRRAGDGRVTALACALGAAVTAQGAIGIATLLAQTPIGLALAHQGMAVIVLAIAVMHAEGLVRRREPAVAAAPAMSPR